MGGGQCCRLVVFSSSKIRRRRVISSCTALIDRISCREQVRYFLERPVTSGNDAVEAVEQARQNQNETSICFFFFFVFFFGQKKTRPRQKQQHGPFFVLGQRLGKRPRHAPPLGARRVVALDPRRSVSRHDRSFSCSGSIPPFPLESKNPRALSCARSSTRKKNCEKKSRRCRGK